MNPRYFQQHLVTELGFASEEKLASAKVLIVGCGGLGTPVATVLAALGIGTIGIIDGDNIEISNLHRQFLYDEASIGRAKADVLSEKLKTQNPLVNILAMAFHLSDQNAKDSVADFDIICDCTDNPTARILLDSICDKLKKPLVYAAVRNWEGYVTILNHKTRTRLSDIFRIADVENTEGCAISGIVPTTCGIIGNLQANEVIKILLDLEGQLDGEIFCFDALSNRARKFKLNRHHR